MRWALCPHLNMKEKIKKVKEIPLKWYKKIIRIISVFVLKHKTFISLSKQFIVAVIMHGVMVNIMLNSLFDFKFTPYTSIGYGILFYLLKEEFVSFIRRIIFKR